MRAGHSGTTELIAARRARADAIAAKKLQQQAAAAEVAAEPVPVELPEPPTAEASQPHRRGKRRRK
jgi:hypothetical protein